VPVTGQQIKRIAASRGRCHVQMSIAIEIARYQEVRRVNERE
jgi:hypothetical protein